MESTHISAEAHQVAHATVGSRYQMINRLLASEMSEQVNDYCNDVLKLSLSFLMGDRNHHACC